MYKYTRQEAAEKMGISTRSVDRYIKAWKLRAKKDWKVVYVKWNDVDNLLWNGESKQEIIIEKKVSNNESFDNKKEIITNNDSVAWTLWTIYKDLKEEIVKKDELIQQLAMRVWKAEEVAKNSVSILDFKKSQYLLEESKWWLNKEVELLSKEKERLDNELKYEKTSNTILIVFVAILLVVAGIIWFIKI
jgi:hypothetical protein